MAEPKFNSDELVPPSFVTEEYILNILQIVEEDPELHLINYEIKPGSGVGDHYASVMFKIIASYGSKGRVVTERRFILKTIPEAEGPKKELLENMPAFKNEILVYTKVLVAMDAILAEHGEKGWWPKLVYSTSKPMVLVFDDLTMDNYQVLYETLDFQGISMVVEKIAKYHALGWVLLERGMKEILEFDMAINDSMKTVFKSLSYFVECLGNEVKTWDGFQEIGEKMFHYGEKMSERFVGFYTTDNSDGINVLNHGDFHMRNLMFKKDDQGRPSELIFLDFQVPMYNSPAFDLVKMLNTMSDRDVRNRRVEVIKLYRDELAANMKLYGCKREVPSAIDIQIELLKSSEQDAFYRLVGLPMLNIKDMELNEMMAATENGPVVQAYRKEIRKPEYVEENKPVIYSLYNRGIFD